MAPRTRSAAAKSRRDISFSGEANIPFNLHISYGETSSAPTPTSLSDGEVSTAATSTTQTPAAIKNGSADGTRCGVKVPVTVNVNRDFALFTPTTSLSSGEVSLPVSLPSMNNVQTPASATEPRRRVVIELPPKPSDSSEGKGNMPDGSNPPGPSRRIRRRAGPFYKDSDEEEDEDDADYFPGDRSRGAARARQLQREEDTMVTPSVGDSIARGTKRHRRGAALHNPHYFPPEESSRSDELGMYDDTRDYSDDSSEDSLEDDADDDTDDDMPSTNFMSRTRGPVRKRQRRDSKGNTAGYTSDDAAEVAAYQGDIRCAPEHIIRFVAVEQVWPDKLAVKRRMLELRHPKLESMWTDLEQIPAVDMEKAVQPANIKRALKPFQLTGLAWMKGMEAQEWKGGVLGDEMGLGKTIQAVSLIMSDYPAKAPSLVLAPPVALMQWIHEIESYTSGQLKTLMYHGTNLKSKKMTLKELKKFDVIIMSYNSLEAMYRKQEKGIFRSEGTYKEKSVMHQLKFHRVILDEAHCIKSRNSGTAKACFALQATYRWCLTGTPLQNRIGEFFSLLRFLNLKPYAFYVCKSCPCECLEWAPDEEELCTSCGHTMLMHVSVFNQEILSPIKNNPGTPEADDALGKLNLLTGRLMLRRLKKDHMNSMELPVKEIHVNRQFLSEEETDFANSIMNNSRRQFNSYVEQRVVLKHYANIFSLIMQMRQTADHPDLILKKDSEGGQNVLVCCICDEPAEEAIRSKCKHDFCRSCAKSYIDSQDEPDCPKCHIPLSIDLEQPEIEQDSELIKKSSIINRIKMENWKSSTKIEMLVHELYRLRSDKMCHKSIIFSQFTSMLQLIQWRLQRAGISTVMLDGSMNPAQRQASIDHFMKNVDVECFLVSLKAGGVALNLTEASRVFIVDPWWNPAAEWQSADRCHRIGQTRPCIITRLCIEDSVESRMVLLQEKKSRLINSTVNAATGSSTLETLSADDLFFLFKMD
ncbi:uncharacterized protein F4807DRAFT_404113 [Annulohypoxylon truncatum]|uniref:uncharacterized protein n=1 Tax=Annulohypoxylon truncatum TaxID=327061 RepID=UPI002008743B|nr:uncharacterized protein F4807DRAFT_404113 [Annulohypoxylon truncatum]KAI1214650.1 hypothetical protein F4807DRAFT_404113 [Annulohypoxylon truncatum]